MDAQETQQDQWESGAQRDVGLSSEHYSRYVVCAFTVFTIHPRAYQAVVFHTGSCEGATQGSGGGRRSGQVLLDAIVAR